MEAVPENKATPINLAQHTYWNLAGHNAGDILNHSIQIWGSQITLVDENTVPTGEIKDTPFDFITREPDRKQDPGSWPRVRSQLRTGLWGREARRPETCSQVEGSFKFQSSEPLDYCTRHAVLHSKLCERGCGQRRSRVQEACRGLPGDSRVSERDQSAKLPVGCGSAWGEVQAHHGVWVFCGVMQCSCCGVGLENSGHLRYGVSLNTWGMNKVIWVALVLKKFFMWCLWDLSALLATAAAACSCQHNFISKP